VGDSRKLAIDYNSLAGPPRPQQYSCRKTDKMTSPVSSGFRPLYKDVLELFEQICTYSPSSATNESLDFNPFSPNLRGIFFEETGRLRVWAENVGVHRQYKASLDHRLREASHVRSMVLQLLSDLKRFLNEGE